MPQASEELRALFSSDAAAMAELGPNYTISRGGIIRPVEGHTPSLWELDAITYLIHEWDYGWDAGAWQEGQKA